MEEHREGESTTKESTSQHALTPYSLLSIGSAAFAGAAVLTGTMHYYGTAKALSKEGIPPSSRYQAFPVAAKALTVSTLGCVLFGALAAWGMSSFGQVAYKELSAGVSISDAISLAKQQRVRFYIPLVQINK
jgi:hypothetical protein